MAILGNLTDSKLPITTTLHTPLIHDMGNCLPFRGRYWLMCIVEPFKLPQRAKREANKMIEWPFGTFSDFLLKLHLSN